MRRRLPRPLDVAIALAVVAAVLAAVGGMLDIGFLNDDYQIIGFALHGARPNLLALLSRAEVIEVYYRPLFDLSLALDFLAWGWSPAGFRATTLALHLVNCALVYAIARRLRFEHAVALLALILFGLHPIHEMSLFWIAGRTDVLCTTLVLGSLVLFCRYRDSGDPDTLVGSLVVALLAMLAKEMAISLPLLVAAFAWWTRRDYEMRPPRRALDIARSAAPFFVIVGGVLLARYWLLGNDLFGSEGVHRDVGVATMARNVAVYLGLLAIPAGHAALDDALRTHPAPLLLAAGAIVLAAGVALVRWRRALAPLLFAIACLLLALVPVVRLTMRWYLYLPSVFFALGLAWSIGRIVRQWRAPGIAFASALVLTYGSLTVIAAREWVGASREARRLDASLAGYLAAHPAGARDTLRFLVIPGKLGDVPLYNLGFAGTVRHLARRDVVVETAAKLVQPSGSERVFTRARGDSLAIDASGSAYFSPGPPPAVQRDATDGTRNVIVTEAGALRVVATNRAGRMRAFAVPIDTARSHTRLLGFDGHDWIELAVSRESGGFDARTIAPSPSQTLQPTP
jgi:hypothetical protein